MLSKRKGYRVSLRHAVSAAFMVIFFQLAEAQVPLGLGAGYKKQNVLPKELSYANPREYEIAGIEVKGVETLNKNALISITGFKVGDRVRLPGSATTTAIRKLWKMGIIGNISISISKIEGDKAWLVIQLTERPRLTRINISGVNKTQEGELKDNLDLIKGRVVSDAVIKNAELTVKDYFIDKGFLNVQVKIKQEKDSIVTNGVALNIRVNKHTKVHVRYIKFVGNEVFGDNKLKSKMKKTHEKIHFTLFRAAMEGLIKMTPKKAWELITKSHDVSKDQLVESLSKYVNINIFKTTKFKRDEYKNDKKLIVDFYNSKGYRDAIITSDTVKKLENDELGIVIHLFEGKKYYFRNIIWSGNFVYTDDLLNKVLGVKKGDVYNMELVNKKLQFNPNGPDISSLYMDNGYLFFRVDPVEMRVVGDSIDLEMRIQEGDQARISRIIVEGNDRTSDHVIRREIRTLPGDYFSRQLLIRTQRELSQLGYFDPEKIGLTPIPNPADGTVDIKYTVVEKPSDQVELSGGWGGYYGFVGTVGLVFNNFSLRNIANFKAWRPLPVGDGQRLSIRIQANGKQYQNYSFTFTEPWLGGKKPNSFTVGINHSVIRTFAYYNVASNGYMTMTTASLGLGKRLKWPDDYFTLTHRLSFTMYNFHDFVSRDNQQIGFTTGKARNFNYNVTLMRNSVDNPMFPRAGSSVSLSLTLTPPFSLWEDIDYARALPEAIYRWIEYYKLMIDAKFYQKLFGNLVFSARAHLGFLNTYTKDKPTGPFDRFQMGGSGLSGNQFIVGYDIIALRGYEDQAITPPSYGRPVSPNTIRGGVAYNKFVFELRYPVTTSQATTIYVLAFAEAGNNFYTLPEYDPFNLYRSAGVGARIFMPAFGLMGIDWGYGFDSIPFSGGKVSGSQFHFSIGQQFR